MLCETVWVLTTSYSFGRAEVAAALGRMLQAKNVTFASADALARALAAYSAGKGDFADYLIRERARAAGCAQVATFHRVLLKAPGFVAP